MSKSKKAFSGPKGGQWWRNNSPGRISIRSAIGQNACLEKGDCIFVLDNERSMDRVCRKMSGIMQYKGDLVGQHLHFPEEKGQNKLTSRGIKFETIEEMIKYKFDEEIMTEPTFNAVQDFSDAKPKDKNA